MICAYESSNVATHPLMFAHFRVKCKFFPAFCSLGKLSIAMLPCLLLFRGGKKHSARQSCDQRIFFCSRVLQLELASHTIYWFLQSPDVLVANKFSFSVKISIDVWIARRCLRTFRAPLAGAWCVSRAITSCSRFLFLCFHIHFILLLSTIFFFLSFALLGVGSSTDLDTIKSFFFSRETLAS